MKKPSSYTRFAVSLLLLGLLLGIVAVFPKGGFNATLPWKQDCLWSMWIADGRVRMQLKDWHHTMMLDEHHSMGGIVMRAKHSFLGVQYSRWSDVLFESGTQKIADVGSDTTEWRIPLLYAFLPAICGFLYSSYRFFLAQGPKQPVDRRVCDQCGYDLRAHQEQDARCPECGIVAAPFSRPRAGSPKS